MFKHALAREIGNDLVQHAKLAAPRDIFLDETMVRRQKLGMGADLRRKLLEIYLPHSRRLADAKPDPAQVRFLAIIKRSKRT
ncbi:MAG: hypothetical protein KGM15_14015 [Pseudomonadota bacterium]|nr:hypothetical protein [Pseudomonadota bacterium]